MNAIPALQAIKSKLVSAAAAAFPMRDERRVIVNENV
jgi:hypothetical protein